MKEGMPGDIHARYESLWIGGDDFFSLDRQEGVQVLVGMCPGFEAEVLEEDERYQIIRHATGIVTRALKEGAKDGTRMSMDTYLDFPVKERPDFEALKWRFDPASPARYRRWWTDYVRQLLNRDYILRLPDQWGPGSINSFYGTLRAWMGTEKACTVFYDDPSLAHDMCEFIADFLIATLDRVLNDLQDEPADYFIWFEDYAYKGGPLVSPRIFKEFLLPCYRRVNDVLRSHGVEVIFQDSDGDPSVLFPLMLEAGINGTWPLEAASGMDPVKVRKEYGHDLLLIGGIDKRVLAQDRKAIKAELLYKMPALLEDGGYIPTLDHTVPPDVSYENWLYYLELKREIAEGKHGG
jgi:uroporphyrinogen decarboxylase